MTMIEKDVILIKGLLCFMEVAACGQVKEAAGKMRMKQSNLSNQLKGLESNLNVVLFNRHPRGVSLTNAGENLFTIACNIRKTIHEIENFSQTTHKVSGEVRLWVSEGIGSSYIPSSLGSFYSKFPDVNLKIISSLKDPSSLSDFDLGIVYHKPHFNNAFEMFEGKLNFYLYASKSYLLANGQPKDLDDIVQNHKLCVRTDFETLWSEWADFFQKAKHVTVRTDSSNLLFSLVNNGLGISFIPRCVAETSNNLVPILKDQAHIQHPFWIICPHQLKDVPKIRALMEHLKETTSKL